MGENTERKTQQKIRQRKARQSLGLALTDSLPRCGHIKKAFVTACVAKGDYSHSGKKHKCRECTCQRIAGQGTSEKTKSGDHFGVGWCFFHEKIHSIQDCLAHAKAMRDAIREGYPCNMVTNMSETEYEVMLSQKVSSANEMISLRDSQKTIIDLGTDILEYIKGKKKIVVKYDENGDPVLDAEGHEITETKYFTESYKGDSVRASDATLFETYRKFAETNAKIAKLELDITDNDYMHIDCVAVTIGEIHRIARGIMDEGQYKEFISKVKLIKDPSAGKRRK